MPRALRRVMPDVPLHITQRGVDRGTIFLDDADFGFYLMALELALEQSKCALHAYVLMRNHVHLLVTPRVVEAPGRLMQTVALRYVRYFNDRHHRTGALYEGRFRSRPVEGDRYFLACARYIELNPVRAGLAPQPTEYAWSSHACNAWGRPDPLVTPHPLFEQLASSGEERRAAYRALVASALEPAVVARFRWHQGTRSCVPRPSDALTEARAVPNGV